MRRIFMGLPVFFALLAATLGALWWMAVRPWTEVPQDRAGIEARWKDVEGWAAPLDDGVDAASTRLGADPEKARASLAAAVAAIAPVRVDVESAVYLDGKFATLERDVLPGGARAALDALRAWDAAGGAMPAGTCGESGSGGSDAIAMLTITRASFAVARSPSDPYALAGLRLARAMRRNGSLLEATIGTSLAETFAETANDRRWPATEPLALLRPRPEEFFAALARDAACVDHMLPGNAQVLAETPRAIRLLGAASSSAFLARERLVYRDWHGARLHAAYPKRADLDAVDAALRVPDPAALPRSHLVRLSLIDASSIIAQWKKAIAADQAYFRDGSDRVLAGPILHEADAIDALRRVWKEYLVTVLGPVPPSASTATATAQITARREVCRTESARVLETLGRPALAAHTVDGAIESLERDGDCWSILVNSGRASGGVLAVLDADDGAALLVWRVPEG